MAAFFISGGGIVVTIYQQELLRKLASMGCAGQIDERDGRLRVPFPAARIRRKAIAMNRRGCRRRSLWGRKPEEPA